MTRRGRFPRPPGRSGATYVAKDDVKRQLHWYVRNCLRSPAAGALGPTLAARLGILNGSAEENGGIRLELEVMLEKRSSAEREACLLRVLRDVVQACVDLPLDENGPERNILFVRDQFGLDEVDCEILLLLLRCERNDQLENLAESVLATLKVTARAVAALLGIESTEARRRLGPSSALVGNGLVLLVDEERHLGFAGPSACLRLARPLRRTFWHCYGSRAEWFAAVVGEPAATTLGWEDFAHLGPVRDLAARVVAGAGAGTRGINLLLHGPVGTGKTEFCKALAARTGRRVWSIGEADEEGGEPSRQERLAALHLVQRLLRRRGDALILFDEAEDLLAGGGGVFSPCERPSWGDGSKVYMNRLLEQNEVPVLWTCNAVGGMDPAVLRRMTLAVEIGTPNQAVRERIWDRVLTNSGVALDAGAIGRLASRYAAPPAVAANAVRAAALAGGGEVEIEQAMAGVLEILGIAPAVADANGGDFDPTLVNCREDIAALVDRIVAAGVSSPWSLCLYGPAGTGKSQFARHMAHRLGLEVFQRRASDLLSKWVGESEKQIARAFEMARARRMLLVIDEADSLLSDRRDAVQSWELTQVNEMLTWMESHPLPFVCTTNLIDRLDQASLRRFTFKLRFEALTLGQAALAFARFFGWPPPRPLADGLTPGDFATVRRRRAVLGAADAETLARWLDEEAEAKGARTMPIGFGRG